MKKTPPKLQQDSMTKFTVSMSHTRDTHMTHKLMAVDLRRRLLVVLALKVGRLYYLEFCQIIFLP